MDVETRRWWNLLRGAALLNLTALAALWVTLPPSGPTRRAHLLCTTVYTIVCAFRSVFPRVDLERTVLVNAWPSSIALGRTAATVAELCFTVQLGLLAGQVGETAGLAWAGPLGATFTSLIVIAQVSCWLGVLTLDHRWHAAEEALWALMMAMLVVVFVAAWPTSGASLRVFLASGVAAAAAASWVMVGIDVPMYFKRWRAENAAGRRVLGVAEGLRDAMRRREPTGAWSVWRHEVPWMTPYFTGCVWLSLGLAWMSP